ncbi:ATP-binding protein [Gryllotalpicola daejeonensis]|uniref:ATP-binding protein n=1 Tax=Gryllotalpicola daejeonensis TaxID=993087 RepID=A0ABP7ZI62_9MICO
MGDERDSALIASLRKAVEAVPTDGELRLHLGELLLGAGRADEAVAEAAQVLQLDPASGRARELMARALAPESSPAGTAAAGTAAAGTAATEPTTEAPRSTSPADTHFDWRSAEADLDSDVEPPFISTVEGAGVAPVYDVERSHLTLADVGGMQTVKSRLEAAFLAPLRNPELRKMYGKSLRGGLLMYGPPGCGKTFIAKALAGELNAGFMSLGVADVVSNYFGDSERNIHEFFQKARRNAPVVVFIDELDTLGQRRSAGAGASHWNAVVNQLLTELDGIETDNEGLYVLGATNQPWQVDSALRRPGRFDRTVIVLPPDAPAREAIFRHHLEDHPVEGIDLARLAAQSEGLTGADIALVCETAVEAALMDSVRSGVPRYVGMPDLLAALSQARPSIAQWLEAARNVVTYGEDDGTFAELRGYLKSVKRL